MTREEIDQATQEFLARGGKIQRLDHEGNSIELETWDDTAQLLDRVVGGIDSDADVIASVVPTKKII